MSDSMYFLWSVLLLITQIYSADLTGKFTFCHVKDENFNACLQNAIEEGIKSLKNGYPDYNLDPLDPFSVATMEIGAGTGVVHLVQNYHDIVVFGLTDIIVNNTNMNFNSLTLTFSTISPLLTQKANYNINGKILVLPVHGSGQSTLTLTNLFANHRIAFEREQRNDEIYYIPKKYALKWFVENAHFSFENLFDGNQLLGDNINRVINQEWVAVFQDVGPGYEDAYSKMFLDYAKGIFERIPGDQIFVNN